MSQTLRIAGGTLVTEREAVPRDLLIQDGRVQAQLPPDQVAFADEILDAHGRYVLPGLIDPHVHFNSPFMGTVTVHDYYTGSRAAAFGGVTCFIDFSTQVKGASLLENLAQKEEEATGRTLIDWSMHGILLDADERTVSEIPHLIDAGCPTFKCFTTYKAAGRMVDDYAILKLLKPIADNGGMLMVHCEDDALIEFYRTRELDAGHFAPIYHARSRPPIVENEAIRRLSILVEQIPAPTYVVHTSTKESVELVHAARERGLPFHSETCTQYLALTEEALTRPNGDMFICSPPLRSAEDVEALWRGLAENKIDVVSTDDAGVPTADRRRLGGGRFDCVPNGMPGIEPRLFLLYTLGVLQGRITLPQLVAQSSTNAARLFGLYPRKGNLEPGADADVVIFDPTPQWTLSARTLHMNTDFCPFEGMPVTGRVDTVLSRGEVIIRDGELVAPPGRGQRVWRALDSNVTR